MGSLSGKRIMVTAGGTREYIDDVRVVTNISTGALGAKIAEELFNRGAEVFYVCGKQSYQPKPALGLETTSRLHIHEIVTVANLKETMEGLIKGFHIDAVVHSAAVSDFTFKRDLPVKLSSSSPEDFVEFLRQTITTTPKIIRYIKLWRPMIKLVGFKFTVGKSYEELFDIAQASLKKSTADVVIANDKAEMVKLSKHRAYLITGEDHPTDSIQMDGKPEIARGIADYLGGALGTQ